MATFLCKNKRNKSFWEKLQRYLISIELKYEFCNLHSTPNCFNTTIGVKKILKLRISTNPLLRAVLWTSTLVHHLNKIHYSSAIKTLVLTFKTRRAMLDPSCTSSSESRLLQPTQSLHAEPTVVVPWHSPPVCRITQPFCDI